MRFPGGQRGLSSLEVAVVVAVFSMFSAILLERMLFYEAYAERVYFDLTIRQMQNALRMRVANLMMEKQQINYIRIASENPMDWLEEKPKGYVPDVLGDGAPEIRDGEWAFDAGHRQIVYRPRLKSGFGTLINPQGVVRVGMFFRYTSSGNPNGLEFRVESFWQER